MDGQRYRDAYLKRLDQRSRPHLELQQVSIPDDAVSWVRCHGRSGVAVPIGLSSLQQLLDMLARVLPQSPFQMEPDEFERWLGARAPLEARVSELEVALRGAREALRGAREELDDQNGWIDRIHRSPSMRIGRALTAPLRPIRDVARRLRTLSPHLRTVPSRVRAGDWKGLMRVVWKGLMRIAADPGELQGIPFGIWVQRHGCLAPQRREAMERRWPQLEMQPLISILMPTFNTDPTVLRATVHSVMGQIYPHWELVLVDDASTDPGTLEEVRACEAIDRRVRVIRRPVNGHISAASNTAFEAAGGEWVGLLDHDDLLTPDALYWVVEEINAHPDCALIYSDEDKLMPDGTRLDAHFKPDWNPDLLRSQNYISHFSVYRRECLEQTGGFRAGFEGAQDYDLVLRVTEGLDPGRIRHIPRILYHWRVVASSTASAGSAKPYAAEAARKALREHLDRIGHKAAVVLPAPGFEGVWWRVRYPLPERPPRVSVLMPTRNGLQFLLDSVSGLLEATDYPDLEIIVIDNGSDDPATLKYLEFVGREYGVKVIRDERPFNFSQLNNNAARYATGTVLLLMNDDIKVLHRDWMREMVSHVLRPEIGMVGARLWFADDTLQHAGCVLGVGGVAGHAFLHEPRGAGGYFGRAALIQNYSAVTAACVVMRKQVFEAVGGFNETDLRVAFNDIDLSLRVLQAGYRNLWTPYAELYHLESASRGYEDTPEKQSRFGSEIRYMRARWADLLDQDPAYNANLSLVDGHFRLAAKPRLPSDPWSH